MSSALGEQTIAPVSVLIEPLDSSSTMANSSAVQEFPTAVATEGGRTAEVAAADVGDDASVRMHTPEEAAAEPATPENPMTPIFLQESVSELLLRCLCDFCAMAFLQIICVNMIIVN